MKNLKGSLVLLIAAFLWGSTFVAQTMGAKAISPFTYNAARSYIGAVFLLILLCILKVARKNSSKDEYETTHNEVSHNKKWPLKAGVACGIVLFLAMGFQQIGITIYPADAAISGRSGFITATYVVLVALFSQFRGKKLHPLVGASVLITVVGMYLLCLSDGIHNVYLGDIIVFLCAICFATQIMLVDRYKNVDSVKLSFVQFLTVAILSTVASVCTETIVVSDMIDKLGTILYAGVLSSGVAFTLQIVGQKYAEPAVASVVMSLESVFAGLTGWLVLSEVLSERELIGCIIVLGAVILAQVPGSIEEKKDFTYK